MAIHSPDEKTTYFKLLPSHLTAIMPFSDVTKGHLHRLVSVSCLDLLPNSKCVAGTSKAFVSAASVWFVCLFVFTWEAVNKRLNVQFSQDLVGQVNLLH